MSSSKYVDTVFVAKEWLLDDPDSSYESLVKFMEDENGAVSEDNYATVFLKRTAMISIFRSNSLEGTLPLGSTASETYNILETTYKNCEVPDDEPWNVDGNTPSRSQMSHHLLALLFLTEPEMLQRDLTVADVLNVHKIMMKNSTGMLGDGGKFRSHAVYAQNHVYPAGDPVQLERECASILASYNDSIRNGICFIVSAADLFYKMITLHPFADGNGRLCRLLVSYALMRAGFPFIVTLCSFHRKSRNHYMMAIFEGRRTGKLRQLRTLILTSAFYVMRNYEDNTNLFKFITIENE
jgi:Fic family protein